MFLMSIASSLPWCNLNGKSIYKQYNQCYRLHSITHHFPISFDVSEKTCISSLYPNQTGNINFKAVSCVGLWNNDIRSMSWYDHFVLAVQLSMRPDPLCTIQASPECFLTFRSLDLYSCTYFVKQSSKFLYRYKSNGFDFLITVIPQRLCGLFISINTSMKAMKIKCIRTRNNIQVTIRSEKNKSRVTFYLTRLNTY